MGFRGFNWRNLLLFSAVPLVCLWATLLLQLKKSDQFFDSWPENSKLRTEFSRHETRWIGMWLVSLGLNTIFITWYQYNIRGVKHTRRS